MTRGKVRIVFGCTGLTLLCLLLLPVPSEMADFWIGCSTGNFQSSNTCHRMCRMLGNLTSCCYGVNYSSRSACGCCAGITDAHCPGTCQEYCAMVSISTQNCAGGNILGDVPKKAFGEISLDNFLFPELELIPVAPVPVSSLVLMPPLQGDRSRQ